MKVVLQRVKRGKVEVDQKEIGAIQGGYVLFVGVQQGDTKEEIAALAKKISEIRLFADKEGKMNLSLLEKGGNILSISQFTLIANTKRGRRPSFGKAEAPQKAKEDYEYFNECLRQYGIHVETGQFGADMEVSLCNDGPVTIVFDTRE
ncbi:D-aminoacyl-tRNA deacylase [Catellicoccus marimammalium]|uniref:D-aminoacyl-tRNA deacylase n=1 Tax=Catellicoccus marimammalium M35/04/3 TaxID=1234409 RepID=K8ZCZ0_9ENTE|nr:D-aminoacyl-tRNA deacylase [Catellicoccus marimammalium]EKU27922.1 D-tyrosyl-tRNA(Tyr) deacylase [Catellicoccus marimammalium M35/04/3]